ncbi:MAG TPA: hypothetical protein PKA31_00035 [Candidatus Moranbacteria bacterium]|nr:hypothetical protein [Candidatus Moranbacteria bacterium]
MRDSLKKKEGAGGEERIVKGVRYRVVEIPRVSDFLLEKDVQRMGCFSSEGLKVGKTRLIVFLLILAALAQKNRAKKTSERKRKQ